MTKPLDTVMRDTVFALLSNLQSVATELRHRNLLSRASVLVGEDQVALGEVAAIVDFENQEYFFTKLRVILDGHVNTVLYGDLSKGRVRGPFDDVIDMMKRGDEDYLMAKIRSGEAMDIDPKKLATAPNEWAKEMHYFSSCEKVKVATKWGQVMLNDVELSEAKRTKVIEAMKFVEDGTGQIAMAELKESWNKSQAASRALDAFAEAMSRSEMETKGRPDVTRSTKHSNSLKRTLEQEKDQDECSLPLGGSITPNFLKK